MRSVVSEGCLPGLHHPATSLMSMMHNPWCAIQVLYVRWILLCVLVLAILKTNTKKDTATTHKHTMPKRHADSTQDENPPKRRQLSADEGVVEAARNGDTTAVRAVLEKLPRYDKTVAFDAAHEACRGNHDECLALLLPCFETTQVGFGMLLSECIHADHVACTEVLLQHWKSVCSNVAFVPHGHSDACPALSADPAVCRVLIDAGADLQTKNEVGTSPLHYACASGALDIVKMLVEAGAGVHATDSQGDPCLTIAAYYGHTETVRYLVGLPEVDVNQQDPEDCTVLHHAKGHANVAQVLLDAGADIEMKNRNGYSPLHYACASGACEVVKMLVEAGAGVRVTSNRGETCLTLAAYHGRTETVRYLVGLSEVDVNQRDPDDCTALHHAKGNANVAQVLLDAGADIEMKNRVGCSPLLHACASGALEVVTMLVEAGAGVRITDSQGDTCLILAAYFGRTETVRYLVGLPEVELNHRAREGGNKTALHCAAEANRAADAQVLIDAGADIETKDSLGRSPLVCACEEGAIDTAKILVGAGAGVRVTDNMGRTCLMLAAYNEHNDTVRYLVGLPEVELNHRAREGGNKTALHCAAEVNHTDIVQMLIDAGADIDTEDTEGRVPLHMASLEGSLDVVKVLVRVGAGVCVTDSTQQTCLMLAAHKYGGHPETVRYLVGLPEVELNQRDSENKTALHWAANKHHTDVVQVLIDAGADIDTKDNEGHSPLHYACNDGELDIAKILVEAGAGVHATDDNGDTCLILAAYYGHTETVSYLVSLPEVDVNHRGGDCDTALDCAHVQKHTDIAQLLLAAGADIDPPF